MKEMTFVVVLSVALLSTVALAGESANEAARAEIAPKALLQAGQIQGPKAEVPGRMNYQGILTKPSGVALDTTVDMTFTIYTESTGGLIKWTETQVDVPVSDGLFNVLLGSVNSIPDTVFKEPERWLGVQVGGDPELDPREQIVSVGYAFRAAEADSADYARGAAAVGGWVDEGTVVRLESDDDSVGIGTANPEAKLDIRGALNVGVDSDGYDVNFYGADSGARLFWDNTKAAFRVGLDSDGTYWAPDSVGNRSFAFGYNTKASGSYSTAMGSYAKASGYHSTALGRSTKASGSSSTVIGHYTTASGQNSTAIGRLVKAGPADYTMVLGRGTVAGDTLINNIENSLMVGFNTTSPTLFVGGPNKRVGIRTADPQQNLHVVGEDSSVTFLVTPEFGPQGQAKLILAEGPGCSYTMSLEYDGVDNKLKIYGKDGAEVYGPHLVINRNNGRVGIGTSSPREKLHVVGDSSMGSIMISPQGTNEYSELILAEDHDGSQTMRLRYNGFFNRFEMKGLQDETVYDTYMVVEYATGNVGIGTSIPSRKLTVRGNILLEDATGSDILELGEGLDYAEGFDVTEHGEVSSGSVLIIDPDNPGQLKLCDQPYDSKVAGIVAGAKGQGSGVRLGCGRFDYDVALAGRVYCNVDATESCIEPGDLLTTSDTPGHAMKATDAALAQGAVLGKAMERLERGQRGQILVLVTLQ